MSGVALYLDGDGADPAVLEGILEALVHRGPDGSHRLLLPWAGLGHRHFWTTPEEVGERQPLRRGPLLLALDGRIDNREDLIASLGLDEPRARPASDAELLLIAWERWGRAALARIVGSWAAVVLDEAAGTATLARDPLGDRSLFYWTDGRRLVAASEPAAVLACPNVPARLDEARIARLLALAEPVRGATFFESVKEVPPAHTVTFRAGSVTLDRYWEPMAEEGTTRRGDEEWIEEFVEVLERAVACRLRSVGRPAVLLSGGLDSGPVAALAARTLAPARLLSVSWTFDELPECDERPWIGAVARMWNLEEVHVPCDDAWPLRDPATWPFSPNGPQQNLYRTCAERGYRAVRAAGARVVLSGYFGDDLYTGADDWFVELVRERRLREAWSELSRESRAAGAWKAVRGCVVSPLVPASVRRWRRARYRAGSTPWLTSYARELLGPDPWLEELGFRSGRRRPRQRGALFSDWIASGVAAEGRFASLEGTEVRSPFRDRRLVELALGIPSHLLHRGRSTRPVVRRGFRGLLPEVVLARTGKTSFGRLLDRATFDPEEGLFRKVLSRRGGVGSRFVDDTWVASVTPSLTPGAHPPYELVLWLRVLLDLWCDRKVE